MVVVTHEMGFCSPCFSRHFPPSGKIEEEGAPEQLFGNPQSPRLQQFLKGSLKLFLRWLTLPGISWGICESTSAEM